MTVIIKVCYKASVPAEAAPKVSSLLNNAIKTGDLQLVCEASNTSVPVFSIMANYRVVDFLVLRCTTKPSLGSFLHRQVPHERCVVGLCCSFGSSLSLVRSVETRVVRFLPDTPFQLNLYLLFPSRLYKEVALPITSRPSSKGFPKAAIMPLENRISVNICGQFSHDVCFSEVL